MRMSPVRAAALAGAVIIICTSTAVALAQGPALTMKVADRSVEYGAPVKVTGTADRGLAGRTVELQFATPGGAWAPLATTTVGAEGRFRFARAVPRSGTLRAVLAADPGTATAASEGPVASVAVTHRIGLRARRLNVRASRSVAVSGRVAPARAGTVVSLQARRGGRWVRLDRDRTSRTGAYRLRHRVRRPGSTLVRVVAAGRDGIRWGKRGAGRLNVFRYAHASWYGPGLYGNRTGCGGRLGYGVIGVAHKSLPCGTRVTFRHRGRTVTAPVIDRGPYVGGREYDLTQATAQRLGFSGHGPILTTR